MEAIKKYGVILSSSRAYLSVHLYEELEHLLSQVFSYPVVVTPTTTLGHFSLMPTVVNSEDAIILDHQVHASVQFAANMVGGMGAHLEMIRHNRMDYLENRIKKLQSSYRKIWYMADGVYSMYGDTAPVAELKFLMDKYDSFHVYFDDAHGMSWMGKNGKGYVLSQILYHPKMVFITSLCKGFGTSGGAVVCYDDKIKELVRNCGGTMIFSGPLQPGNLGAAVKSAEIHLSKEINERQEALFYRIEYFKKKAIELNLPIVSKGETPIFFLGVGKPETASNLCKKIMTKGFFTCIAVYPSVPYNHAGIRIMLNLHHSMEDIDTLLDTLSKDFLKILEYENTTIESIFDSFNINSNIIEMRS